MLDARGCLKLCWALPSFPLVSERPWVAARSSCPLLGRAGQPLEVELMESTGRRTLASRLNCLCIWLNQMRSDRFHIGHVDPSTRRGVHLREATVRWRGNAAAARPVGVLQAIQTAAPSRRPDLFGPSPG